jgi:methyl-accepting chemotaxis protein
MGEIVGSVQRVTDIIGEITAATQEQASGLGQINQAISQMDQVTQQNAALVEEAAASSHAMQEQAGQLAQLVSQFKLDERFVAAASGAKAAPVAKAAPAARQQRVAVQPAPRLAARATKRSVEDEWEQF